MKNYLLFSMAALLVGASCNTKQEKAAEGFTGAPGEVKLITLDPGHFHAALVQKVSYPQVSKGVGLKAILRQSIFGVKTILRKQGLRMIRIAIRSL